jgi:hypothetical protein
MTQLSGEPTDSGTARTLLVRLRREPGSGRWRGQAICVQTGATAAVMLDSGDVAQLAAALGLLLAAPPVAPPTD